MSRLLLAAAVFAVLIYTMVLGVHWLTPRIEKDIATRVTTGMAEQGLLWADVAVKGRIVTLTGEAPTDAAKQKALGVAASVFGVSQIQDKLYVAGEPGAMAKKAEKRVEEQAADELATEIAKTYNLTITKDGDNVILAGNVPDEASKDMLVRLAVTHYNGASHVNTEGLKIVKGAPAGWRTAVGAILMHVTNLEQAKITISGTEVMVSGTVLSRQFSDQMEKAVKQVLPTKYKVAFAVDVVTPTTPAVKVAQTPAAVAPKAETKVEAKAETAKAEDANVAAVSESKVVEKSFFARAKEAVAAKVAAIEPAAGPAAEKAPEASPVATDATCADLKTIAHSKLNFAFDKAEITEAHTATLKKVADAVKACPKGQVVVAGYTDITGSHLYNRWLSQQRAEAGMRGLLREGVAKDDVHAVGYGELHPVATNSTRAGRAANRRVVFTPGSTLPFPLPGVHDGVKHGKHVRVSGHKAKATPVATKVEILAPAAEAPVKVKAVKTVSGSTIRKPWWAQVETGKAVSATGESIDNVHKAVDHMLQPQPTQTVKQPPLAKETVEKPWLGDDQ